MRPANLSIRNARRGDHSAMRNHFAWAGARDASFAT